MKNQVQLITYANRLGGGSIKNLHQLLNGSFLGLFGGVHILPFYFPINGIDAGFDPIDHTIIDPELGNWSDIKALGKDIDLMADLIVNHISANSPQFIDFSENGEKSPYSGLFLTMGKVFPQGATESDLISIYRPRPGLPFTNITIKNGQKHLLWTTFTNQQVDIDVTHPLGKAYLQKVMQILCENGIHMLRLDAVGFAIKKSGSSCFMIPETFDFIDEMTHQGKEQGIEVLVEIHSYYKNQIEIAPKVDYVYDFALPPLILHAIFTQNADYLKKWLKISPRNSITVLDTHDGIGIIDIGSDRNNPVDNLGLIPQTELDTLIEQIHINSNGQSRKATGEAAANLDLYQINCTFYDALGRNDENYLIARAIQFFSPGVPQVYYVGLLAGENDMELLSQSGVGRDINRHFYTKEDIDHALLRNVVQSLFSLIRFRNQHPAFNGTFSLSETSSTKIAMRWDNVDDWALLEVDLGLRQYQITHSTY